MQFLIVSDLDWCNIWQVFNTDTPVATDCKQETETNCEQVYDVVFNDDTAINSTWIEANRHDNTTYFADYKGGTVSIVEVNTGNYVYNEQLKYYDYENK